MGRSRKARRILLVCDSLEMGGAERHVVGVATALRARGHDVAVACSTAGMLADAVREDGVEVHVLGDRLVKRSSDRGYRDWLRNLGARLEPDIIHAHMHASAIAAADLSKTIGVPLVVTEHSEATWRDAVAWSDIGDVYAQSTAIITVSEAIAQRLGAATGVDTERIHVIRNGLNFGAVPRSALSRHLPCRNMVGVVARLLPEKGVDVFLRAAARLTQVRPRMCFVVVGDGPERGALQELADELGIRSTVGFLGPRAEAVSTIQRLDVLCVPSRSEGTPLVVLEAMAAGTPIVASNVGGIPEQVKHQHEALLVPPEDDEALAEQIRRVLEHRLLRLRLTRRARRRVRREFSAARMVNALEHVYAECLGSPPPAVEMGDVIPLAASA
ncbi:MAG: glycosyltransferase [Candidatus Dormibacteria bacterium]